MQKIFSNKIIRGIIIGLGLTVLLLSLGIKFASENRLVANPEVSPSSSAGFNKANIDSQSVESSAVLYIINDGKEKKAFTLKGDLPASATVFSLLEDFSKKENFEMKYNNNYKYGIFVESIIGIKNGQDGLYWQYYVNDKLGEVAADKKEVKAGDKVEWKFEKADF